MKRMFLTATMAVVLVIALGSCSSVGSDDRSDGPASPETQTGLANPWNDVASAEEAAEGAGLDSFTLADGLGVSDWSLTDPAYRCMDGIAEVRYQGGAFQVTVRKSAEYAGQELTGDYNEYEHEWTQDCNGVQVSCRGYEEGQAASFDWTADAASYSAMFEGLGGEHMAVDADEVAAIVSSIQ